MWASRTRLLRRVTTILCVQSCEDERTSDVRSAEDFQKYLDDAFGSKLVSLRDAFHRKKEKRQLDMISGLKLTSLSGIAVSHLLPRGKSTVNK
jgi:hypothetical protein